MAVGNAVTVFHLGHGGFRRFGFGGLHGGCFLLRESPPARLAYTKIRTRPRSALRLITAVAIATTERWDNRIYLDMSLLNSAEAKAA